MLVTADSANNAVYHKALEEIREAMMEGQGLAGPIARSGLFPEQRDRCFAWARRPEPSINSLT